MNRFLDYVGVVQVVTMVLSVPVVLEITSLTPSFNSTLTIPEPEALEGTRLECGGDMLDVYNSSK